MWGHQRLPVGEPVARWPRQPARATTCRAPAVLEGPCAYADIDQALAEFTRIDTAIYWYETKREQLGAEKSFLRITLHKSPAERILITPRNGDRRPAFRCGTAWGDEGVKWVELPASLFGIDESGKYPLYVQSHAIRNLHQRLPINADGLVHDCMVTSFSYPKVTQDHRGDYLVEYRFFDHKLGYFHVEFVERAFLATTFKFLTMSGTPEADFLHKQLRLKRPDIEQLGLDSLQSFLFSDLQKDEELVRVFEKCGCGHLLRMARPETQSIWKSGKARDVRSYLGMKLI